MTTPTPQPTPQPGRRVRRLATVGAAAVLAIPLVATAAAAQTPTRPDRAAATAQADPARLEEARTRCLAEIDRRLATLDRIEQAVASATALTEAHRSALQSMVTAERESLGALRPEVEAAPDRATLESTCRSIVTDHRIYKLRVPQASLTLSFDRADAGAARLATGADKLQAKVDERAASGEDVAAAQAAVDTMRAEIASATGAIDGQADALLALTPADYEADNAVVAPFRGVLAEARVDLREAVAAGRDAAGALRG